MTTNKNIIPTWRGHYAGFASRLVAIIIDILILSVALAVTFFLYNIIITNLVSVSRLVFGRELIQRTPASTVVVTVVIVFVVLAIYFIFFWAAIGTTIGGLILGIKIVNRFGKNPSVWQSIVRFLAEFFFPVFGVIESLWILFNRQRRAVFDMIAGTFVVYTWDAKPDEIFLKRETDQIVAIDSGRSKN